MRRRHATANSVIRDNSCLSNFLLRHVQFSVIVEKIRNASEVRARWEPETFHDHLSDKCRTRGAGNTRRVCARPAKACLSATRGERQPLHFRNAPFKTGDEVLSARASPRPRSGKRNRRASGTGRISVSRQGPLLLFSGEPPARSACRLGKYARAHQMDYSLDLPEFRMRCYF